MKTLQPHRLIKASLLALGTLAFATATSWATVVTWDLNPTNANASAGSASQTFTSSGSSITAYGFDVGSPDTPHTLYYKDAGPDHGLGLVETPHFEIQTNNYIQLDLTSILSQGFVGGQIKISSIDPNETFNLYGSNTLGTLGTKLTGSPFGESNNNAFLSIPDFGTYNFISVISENGDVLISALSAEIRAIPEAACLVPVLVLVVVATAFEARRRRRATA